MNYQSIVSIATHILTKNPTQAIMIHGAPGCGKSHAATIGLRDALGLPDVDIKHPDSGVSMFRPSNHDPVDVTGLPSMEDGVTKWLPPKFLMDVNAKAERYGKALFVIDELNQATPMMFNTLNGLMLDRFVGEFKLHPGVMVVGTGNRQIDKAASNRMPTHTANRLFHLDMDSDLNGWCNWAIKAGMPMWLVAFLRFKPALLNDFNPDRRENPTERTWEMLGKVADEETPRELTYQLARGYVGEGAAAEVTAFRQVMEDMPNPDAILLDPENSVVPETLSAKYALCGALAHRASKNNIDAIVTYCERLPAEFSTLCIKDSYQRKPEIAATPAFIAWAAANANVLV